MRLWIARTRGGKLRMFFNKPNKTDDGKWFYLDDKAFVDSGILVDKNNFPEVTFENSPQEVELKLREMVKSKRK